MKKRTLETRRKKAMGQFFRRIEGLALGFIDRKWKRERWKEVKEEMDIQELTKTLLDCPFCKGKPELRWERNTEYPEGAYVVCLSCGNRTNQFVKFIDIKIQHHEDGGGFTRRATYSKLESVKYAIKTWNRRS